MPPVFFTLNGGKWYEYGMVWYKVRFRGWDLELDLYLYLYLYLVVGGWLVDFSFHADLD